MAGLDPDVRSLPGAEGQAAGLFGVAQSEQGHQNYQLGAGGGSLETVAAP
jgi:hypothetical protein